MAELQTQQTKADVADFIAAIDNDQRRADCQSVLELMHEVTGAPPAMWGPSIVGFGHYHYRYASGREGDWFLTGFSPRKQALTLYIMGCLDGHEDRLAQLGTYKHGKACLYIKRLSDVNLDILRELVQVSVQDLQDRYGAAQPAAAKKKTAAKK
jgi:hypothetical protein